MFRLARAHDLPFRVSWRLRRWAAARAAAPSIAGGLERPDRKQRYSRSVDVRGWVSVPEGRRAAVDVLVGHTRLQRLPLTPTPGAPVPAGQTRASFDAVVPLDRLPARAWLRVVASLEDDPSASRVLGITRLVRARPGDKLPQRAAYGAVWDAVSTTLSDAQFSVAGTTDAAALLDSGRSTADDVARETGIQPTDTVLEIGCGVGRVGTSLATRSARWIGADVSAEMLRHATSVLAGQRNVTLVLLNGVDLAGIDDASVDVAYCTGVFMHLDEWERYRYLAEAFRVLRPGGRVYVDNINLLSAEGWTIFTQTMRMDPLARPVNVSKTSTPEELSWFATQAGFVDVRTRGGSLWITAIARKPGGPRSPW
ncbi:MAG: class I SAM-dependent methyltransferase [Vicinamibacteraceae bacterium]